MNFATMMKRGEDFPAASISKRGEYLVSPPMETVAKAALYETWREAKITRVSLQHDLV